MKIINISILILINLFVLISNKAEVARSKPDPDQTGHLTPLVATLTSEDIKKKVNGVDLIFVVDISGSMSGDRINLVKESLNYIVDLMNEQDNMSLVIFESRASLISGLVPMTENNKKMIINKINQLKVTGGTNIYSGLQMGLNQIIKNYKIEDRVCSIILLSDGCDQYKNADTNFKSYIINQKKNDYVFTVHTLGYGNSHDALLMKKIAAIRDGGYFFIQKLTDVNEAFLQIYGSLSSNYAINVNVQVQSNFQIKKVFGMDEMYNASLTSTKPYTFNVDLIHYKYGKTYSIVSLVDIPDNTPYGTEVLKVSVLSWDQIIYFYWDKSPNNENEGSSPDYYDSYAYEEYIKGICADYFSDAYNKASQGSSQAINQGKAVINNGILWLEKSYDGVFDWKNEFQILLNDLTYFSSYGKANILSKIRELKSQNIGNHYYIKNTYENSLIDESHDLNTSTMENNNITVSEGGDEKIITTDQSNNYYYFYLKEGVSKINGTRFSGEHSTLVIYTENVEDINIKALSNYFEYYSKFEKKNKRIQTFVDIGSGGNFIIKKDFPFDFYTYVDGTSDIIFNIQFLKFEYKEMTLEPQHLIEIKAFIIDETQVNNLNNQNPNYLPSATIYKGYYDRGFRIGKVLLKKEDITRHLNSNSIKHFYLYVVVQKAAGSNVVYTKVEGQFSFVKMNFINNHIPEGFYIFNNLAAGQKSPHTYSVKMEPHLGKKLRIEFASSGNELDCKILKYNNYDKGTEEVYTDYEELNIHREYHMGKTYIYVSQSDDEKDKFDDLIISVFSNNQGHTAGNESTKLAYIIRYTTESNFGIYNYNDINDKNGEVVTKQEINLNEKDIKVTFYPLKYQKLGEKYNRESTRYFLKVYQLSKSRQKIYDSISLFENDIPLIYKEIYSENENELSFNFKVSIHVNYFFTLYTISKETNEILSYTNKKLYRHPKDISIDDNNSFENEFDKEVSFDLQVSSNIKKTNLVIQIFDFDDDGHGDVQVLIENKSYKLNDNNLIEIPKDNCKGKTVHIDVSLKDGSKIEYYLLVQMTDQTFDVVPSTINYLTYTVQNTLHVDSEYVKAYTLNNGDVLALSSVVGTQQSKIGKLNNEGKTIYGNASLSYGYSPDAQLVQPADSDFYFLTYHNKQNIKGHEAKEKTLTFKDKNIVINEFNRKNSTYQKTSLIALKNGKIFVAGINPLSAFGAETIVEVNIYNPKTGKSGVGISFNATSKYISCYEQVENNVYCVYVSYETVFISKLKIKHFTINGNILTNEGDQMIKVFYTEFNFLKAIKFNDKESLVLFQTGNGKTEEKSGKDLYLFHLEINTSPNFIVTINRYDYLHGNCLYNKDNHDPEYYNADIAVLSSNRIYAVCETQLNKFRGFIIYPGKETVDEFYFNNFNADNVKNPVFAKFGRTLGIFYTHINENKNSKTAYQLMNYPDCVDYRTIPILIPKGFMKEFDLTGKIFLSNPYPANRKEVLKVRFKSYSNITITNTLNDANIIPDFDYHSSFSLKFKPKGLNGIYDIKYTATRRDALDGLIIGKTCKITFNTPECLEQCESCTEKGTEEHHGCLGCKENGPYYEEEDPTAVNDGYGKPHFCRRCNISCSSCYAGFLLKPTPTTNCKKCDINNNYFPYEFDERTCISNETKEYWQSVVGYGLYLDKSAGVNKKGEWRWRHCHENCAECFEKGDDINNKCNKCKKDYYFFCNQTVGHGIPGSCYTGCKNNGFYIKLDEGREKCCPCINHCKECQNNKYCDKCYPPFFKTENGTLCNESCGYCLAEDKNLWECVNCKTRFDSPKYNLNKTCVNDIPFIESIKRYHHIVDDSCNLLHGCKEGCHKCAPWYSDNCTECISSYYKEDFYGKEPQPKTFHCFDKETCKGVTPYIHDIWLKIGGVPILENNENVCLNCKLRNNSYRLPEDDFYCGNKTKRTYIDIEDYNKLSYCYFRCKDCDYWGNSYIMNCTECRDSNNYHKQKVGNYYNCYRPKPKCGLYPYYHDYDLAEALGKDEDNCGEDCDVCMYNFTCPEFLPYFVFETHECVEFCPIVDVLGNSCALNNARAGILLLQNPFGLKNPYDFLNTSVTLNQIISSKLFQYFSQVYDIDANSLKKDINNYLGSGKIYNLPESKVIIGNNISIELSSINLELQKLKKLFNNDKTVNKNVSIVDLSECSTILKNKYNLSKEEDLIIVKGDFLQQLSEQYIGSQVDYQIFSTSLGAFLPLNYCKKEGTPVTVTSSFNSSLFFGDFQYKVNQTTYEGYDIFDPKSSFYNDICTPFTNENGNDVLLDDRRNDYFSETYNLCEKNCIFMGYNASINMYTCNCTIKEQVNDKSDEEYKITPMEIPPDFFKRSIGYSNIKIFKCASEVFSIRGQKMNFGSYILFICFLLFVFSIAIYSCSSKQMDKIFKNLIKPEQKRNNHPSNPPKNEDTQNTQTTQNTQKKTYDDLVKKVVNPINVLKDVVFTEEDLNMADYEDAKKHDKRSYMKYYWSLLKRKQIFLFTFYTSTDHNLRIVKEALFILFVTFFFAFTALFFNDKIMREIYIYKGNTDAAIYVTNIILSSFCCLIMNLIIRFVSINERDVYNILKEKNTEERLVLAEKTKRCQKIKIAILFTISLLLIGLFWYYVSAFCAIFKNSQGHYLFSVLVSFIICNIWPFVTSLIAPFFRISSLKSENNSPCMYKFSQIISYL